MNTVLSAAEHGRIMAGLWTPPEAASVAEQAKRFRSTRPFPHLVLDNLFDPACLSVILRESPDIPHEVWNPHYTRLQSKRVVNSLEHMPPALLAYFETLHSATFVSFLETLTGLSGLQPDLTLYGGGLHEARHDGHFEIHVDFQKHPVTRLRNALVVITYLNEGWQAGDGGELELWDAFACRSEVQVAPLFGRTLIMEQSEIALHGYPRPLVTGSRRALITYFYKYDLQVFERQFENTHYLRRPGLPADRRLQMVLRDYLPKSAVSALRRLRSNIVYRRQK
ncbi:2OG-Fe(II) oxygenase [Acetobacter sp.]|jgi:hypothetical protein|uniref:2OG-Fe(II) oxygenase n=1 Tax=Acetobacter sp. TaxID=440 RepID=UPI0025B9661E|nr:2OG-Fe(II) oxygenase [Acetobacter sp.]MCH4090707.1 2OG-Fe(II) oxygenase [Acetobacter sp.]MCI1300150.1 2OG-Fe(II) oxygenase [Acetobacter sp.]MCI1316568.1 2OG-Fe(II) oxygenase [Acetobacter sp.]